jgi:hypothetical protein
MIKKVSASVQHLTTRFEDKAKPGEKSWADTFLKPVMWVAGGKTVRYMANVHGGKTFSAPKEVEGKLAQIVNVAQKIAAIGLVILGAPIFVPALIAKATNQTDIALHKNFMEAAKGKNQGKDRVSYQEEISSSFLKALWNSLPEFNVHSPAVYSVIDPIVGSVAEELQYEQGKTAAHVLNDGTFSDMAGGFYFITIKELGDDFREIGQGLENSPDEDLKNDLKLLNQMMPEMLDAAAKDLPVIGNNLANNTLNAVIGSISSLILGGVFGKRVSEFQEAIPKLAVGETKIFAGNMKMGGGFHTISLAVTRREVGGKSVYDLMVTNTGGACGWHIWKKNSSGESIVLPLILEGMTLEQITDKEFVKGLKFHSTCGEDDPSGYELYGHLKDYAMEHKNIGYIGKLSPSNDTVRKEDELKIQKYADLGMPLQNLGNCICRSPIAMINAVMRQMGKNPQRIFLMLAVSWRKASSTSPIILKRYTGANRKLSAS